MRLVAAFSLLIASLGADSGIHTAATPRFVVIVNTANTVGELHASQLREVLLGSLREWPNHRRITIVQRDAKEPVVGTFLKLMLGMSVGDYNRYLMNLEFKGKEAPALKTLLSNESACNFVFNAPGAIGFLPASFLGSGPCGLQVKIVNVPDNAEFLSRSATP